MADLGEGQPEAELNVEALNDGPATDDRTDQAAVSDYAFQRAYCVL